MPKELEINGSAETLVETPAENAAAPLTTAAELALYRTSHLAQFSPKLDEPNVDSDEPVELPEQKFPKTLKSALEYRAEFLKDNPTAGRSNGSIDRKLKALDQHIFNLQQVPPSIPIAFKSSAAAPEDLKIVASLPITKSEEAGEPFTARLWDRVRTDCATQISALLAAVKEYDDLRADLSSRFLLPGQAEHRTKVLKGQHSAATPTPEEMTSYAKELATLREISESQEISFNARRSSVSKFLALEPFITGLEAAVSASFDLQISDFVKAEKKFFAAYGLPREVTALVRIATQEKARGVNTSFHHAKNNVLTSPQGHFIPSLELSCWEVLLRAPAN